MLNKSVLLAAGLLTLGVAGVQAQVSNAPERVEERQPGTFSVGPMLEYSSGKFGGTQSTEIWSIGAIARYERGPWVVRLTVPYVDVSGPGNVVPTGGGAGTPVCGQAATGLGARASVQCAGGTGGTTSSSSFSESGLGDVTLGAGLTVVDLTRTTLDLTAKVKFPTADEKMGLGTGEFDTSLQGDLYQAIGKATVFVTAGYRWYGDPPGIVLEDALFGALGATYAVTPQATFGVAYDYRQPTYAGGASLNEVSLLASFRVAPAARLRGYVFKGLTDGGPDWGAGISALISF